MKKFSTSIKLLRSRRFLLVCSLAMGLLAAGIAGIIGYSEWRLAKLVPGGLGERFPTKVYAAPFLISTNREITFDELTERLRRLDYKATGGPTIATGTYVWQAPRLTIGLRGFESPIVNQPPQVITLTEDKKNRWSAKDMEETDVPVFFLEPEMVAELSGATKIRRDPAGWEEFPPLLIETVIAIEDRRFYRHNGLDFRAILRAAWFNLRHRRNLQGGSTITQQLAKNFFLTQERTIQRKILEAGFALYLDLRTSKEKILTLYLNHIYMGQEGATSIAGMKAASEFYFGRPMNQLSVPETALLAGIIRSPYRYNPFQVPLSAKARRDTVLRVMLNEGIISEREFETARRTPIATRKKMPLPPEFGQENDYFVSEVIRQLVPRFSEDVLFRYGLRIFTTLDPVRQQWAQQTLRKEKYQAALVEIDPQTGAVLALVGGKNFRESQFNRATQAKRQPGSTFKPFVYGAAIEAGFTPATLLTDEPRAYKAGKKIWAPQNFDGVYRGQVALRTALAQSLNGATLDLAQKISLDKIISFAQKLGIESPIENSLAIVLGASEVSLLELTGAYSAFANGGFRVTPYLVTAVMDSEKNVLEFNPVERHPVLDPTIAYLITSLLGTVVQEGTAKPLSEIGWEEPSAGKTGTTNAGKDAWFIGYTQSRLVGVWVGSDEAKAINLTGAKNALPLWGRYMLETEKGKSGSEFKKPEGIVTAVIDPTTGLLARTGCPARKEELFTGGTEPKTFCSVHAGGLKGWLKRIFRRT